MQRENDICLEMIYRSCVIKKTVVENDPTEQGERAVLNLGHTIGHAVEKLKNFTMSHGACVAVGCAASAFLSMKRGWLTKEEYEEILEQIKAFDLPVYTENLCAEEILQTTKSDKIIVG